MGTVQSMYKEKKVITLYKERDKESYQIHHNSLGITLVTKLVNERKENATSQN